MLIIAISSCQIKFGFRHASRQPCNIAALHLTHPIQVSQGRGLSSTWPVTIAPHFSQRSSCDLRSYQQSFPYPVDVEAASAMQPSILHLPWSISTMVSRDHALLLAISPHQCHPIVLPLVHLFCSHRWTSSSFEVMSC